ncbi:MAG TPA: cobaltochelatase subunit CobT, partial [Sphingomonadaceae bacterium]|nr:cobaltochelatase subunit CobT [Sphingomonadaceae bacterium]
MPPESPLDRFKQVLTGASRAIAREPELEVGWTADAPSLQGDSIKVPMPPRTLPREQASEARGFADSFALRLRYHNARLHARHAPQEASARACYDAVEAVRYEALGENNYAGIRDNLAASLEIKVATDPISRADRAEDVPLQSALALMLRERLTGQPIPERAQAGVELVREF